MELRRGKRYRGESEPVAAIGHPPAQDANGNGGEQGPQNGHGKIGDQAQRDECSPEDLSLHPHILAREADLSTAIAAKVSFAGGHASSSGGRACRVATTVDRFLLETD